MPRLRHHADRAVWNPSPVEHTGVVRDLMAGRATGGDRLHAKLTLFDREGHLTFRCAELAFARDIACALWERAAPHTRNRR